MTGPVDYDACTVDELIELGSAPAGGVSAELGAITATASGDGVEVTVNLAGRLVGLVLAPHALATRPSALAAEIVRLTLEASTTALDAGVAVLAPVVGEELAGELRALVLPRDPAEPARTEATDRYADDDFSTIETWALPR